MCPLLWSDLTVASYSVRTLATSSLGVSPALPSMAADGIFIAVDTELGFSQASAVCLASGHWRLFTAHSIQGSKAALCGPTCVYLPRHPAPRQGPGGPTVSQNASRDRGCCGCPCLSTYIPVQCLDAWGLAAPSECVGRLQDYKQCHSLTGPLPQTYTPTY